MTISKYISNFIREYEAIKIDTNHIQDGSDKYGMFKSPARDIKRNIDDSCLITEYYQFFAKQEAVSETDRKESDEWLEDLTYWVDDYVFNSDYPEIDKGRRVVDIQVTGCPTPFEDQDSEILYQISLSITYEREDV